MSGSKKEGDQSSLDVGEADMKNILGYLNQNEWVFNLNIGNIMQISAVSYDELV